MSFKQYTVHHPDRPAEARTFTDPDEAALFAVRMAHKWGEALVSVPNGVQFPVKSIHEGGWVRKAIDEAEGSEQ